jgi:hypothetical protein
MRFDYLLIAFLMVSFIAIAGSMMISDMNTSYADMGIINSSNDSFNQVYNATNNIKAISDQAYNTTLKAEIEGGSTSIDSMLRGSYSTLRLIGATFGLYQSIVLALASVFGIPTFAINIAITIFTISVVFSLVYMLFRYIQG